MGRGPMCFPRNLRELFALDQAHRVRRHFGVYASTSRRIYPFNVDAYLAIGSSASRLIPKNLTTGAAKPPRVVRVGATPNHSTRTYGAVLLIDGQLLVPG